MAVLLPVCHSLSVVSRSQGRLPNVVHQVLRCGLGGEVWPHAESLFEVIDLPIDVQISRWFSRQVDPGFATETPRPFYGSMRYPVCTQ